MIPHCGTAPGSAEKQYIVGAKQLKRAILDGRAAHAFFADNADPAITEPLQSLCEQHGIPYSRIRTMAELGRICGIEVGAAAAAIAGSI